MIISPAEVEIFSDNDTKTKVLNCVLHSADVSNPCKGWEVTHDWAMVCLEEFFAQGDQEKVLGIPVQFLNDRDKLNKPNSQIGFIEFMISPFFVAQIRLWPNLHEMGSNLAQNITNWQDMWEKEVNPAEEEKSKVKGRVDKVTRGISEAIARAPL
ncbi:Pde1c [Symbiodinium sp. CCMP2456]|nr:Pde1c [Symbiodinium sp. CCMP2456]